MATGTPGVFDSDEPFDYLFAVSRRIYLIVEMSFWIRFREFTAPAKAASVGGGATSGASSSSTSASGGGSSPTSGGGPHVHPWMEFESATPGSFTKRRFKESLDSGVKSLNVETNGTGEYLTGSDTPSAHTHTVTIGPHTHDIAHTHTTPAHAHGLEYGIFKEPMPATIDVNVGLWHRPFEGGAWQLIASIDGLSEEEQYVDVTSLINTDAAAGLWRLTFQSAPGQPNNGRLTVDVVHEGVGAMASA